MACNAIEKLEFDAAIGGSFSINLVGDYLTCATWSQDEEPVVKGFKVQIATGASNQKFTLCNGCAHFGCAASDGGVTCRKHHARCVCSQQRGGAQDKNE